MKLRELVDMIEETTVQWWNENTSTLGAALAYYAVFALAPLAVLAVTISGYLYGKDAAQGELYHRLESTVGPAFAQAIQESVRYSNQRGGGSIATIISIGVILFGAVNLFNQLQHSLNTIWGVQPKSGRSWWEVIKTRLMPFVVMLLVSLLLLASLISSTVLQALGDQIADLGMPGKPLLWRFLNWVVSFVLVTAVFALIFRVLPDVVLRWRDVLIGATLTTVLFLVGNFLIGFYLSRSGTASTYGAAGSLVVILLWVYYSSQVLLLGAEFTQVYASHFGGPVMSASAEALSMHPRRKAVCREAPRPEVSHS